MEKSKDLLVYWTLFILEKWQLYIAATLNGLVFVGSQDKSFDELEKWVRTRLPHHTLQQNDEGMKIYSDQFKEYFQGERTTFSFPVDLFGTPFQQQVWHALSEIPHGRTYSYSDIAHRIQKPQSVRAVGTAIGANPILIAIPCHRVIGKNGHLTGYRGGLEMKTDLLELEIKGL
jgi:methylated-DNA-[protein]-cysteine S-methyltransferase